MNSNTNMNNNSWNYSSTSNDDSNAYLIGSSTSNSNSNTVPALSPYDGYASDAYFSSPSPPPAHKSQQAGMLITPPTYWSSSFRRRQENCLSDCSSSLTNTPELESRTFAAADSQKMMYDLTTPSVDPMLFATGGTSNGSFTNQAIYPQQQLMMPLIQHETHSQKLLSHFYQQPSFITHATVGGDISYALHPATSYYPTPIMSNATTTATTFEGGSANTIHRYSTYSPYQQQQQQQQQHGFYNNNHHHRSSSSSSSLYSSSPLMRTTTTNSTTSSKVSIPSYVYNNNNYNYENQQLNFNHSNHCNNYSSASQTAASSPSVKYEQQLDFPQQQRINNHHMTNNNNNRQSNSNNIFPCSVPNCNKLFSRPYNLKSHMRTHTHERPFECKYKPCGWKFARPHDLKRHELQHTGQKPHGCTFCHRRFARSDALKRHWKVDTTCAQALKQELLVNGGKESSIVTKKKRSTTKKQQQ